MLSYFSTFVRVWFYFVRFFLQSSFSQFVYYLVSFIYLFIYLLFIYLFIFLLSNTHLVKWFKPPFGHKPNMTQLTGVLIAHAQPFLHAELVYETEATLAITRTDKELPYICILGVPGCLADPTSWCVAFNWAATEAIDRGELCELKQKNGK